MQHFSNVLLIYCTIRNKLNIQLFVFRTNLVSKNDMFAFIYLVIFIPQHCDLLYLQYQNKARSKLMLY